MQAIMISKEGLVETAAPAKDKERVYWVDFRKGLVNDLPPTGKPPIIMGITTDNRLLVEYGEQGGTPDVMDVMPESLGLTPQAVLGLRKYVFPQKK